MKALAALAAILFATAAQAGPILLTGTIGKAPVFVELDHTGDTVSGWYFYLKVGKQIRLDGKLVTGGLFDVQEYTASTNSRTGAFKGRIKNGRWTGTWKNAAGKKALPFVLNEVHGSLKDTRLACSVRAHDTDFGTRTKQSLDLTVAGGRVKALNLKLDETGDGGAQSCHLALSDLRQVPASVGLALKARGDKAGGDHHCTVRFYPAGDFVVVRLGNPSQQNDDCRGAGTAMFCTPNAFWLGLTVNRQSQVCKQVK